MSEWANEYFFFFFFFVLVLHLCAYYATTLHAHHTRINRKFDALLKPYREQVAKYDRELINFNRAEMSNTNINNNGDWLWNCLARCCDCLGKCCKEELQRMKEVSVRSFLQTSRILLVYYVAWKCVS